MWNIYDILKSNEPKAKVIEVLVLLSSVRRSLFTGDDDRQSYLKNLITGVIKILKNRGIIKDEESYHQLSRLLSRIKSNFQLKEFLDCGDEIYDTYLELCHDFTLDSFKSNQFSQYSTYYLLNLWSRLVSSQPYLHSDKDSKLKKYIPNIFKEYVKSRLLLSQNCTENGLENPIDDKEKLYTELESLPSIAHFEYEKYVRLFVSLFDPIFTTYTDSLKNNPSHWPGQYSKLKSITQQMEC